MSSPIPDIPFGENLPPVESYSGRIVVTRDIPFSEEGREYQKLDLYLPTVRKGEAPAEPAADNSRAAEKQPALAGKPPAAPEPPADYGEPSASAGGGTPDGFSRAMVSPGADAPGSLRRDAAFPLVLCWFGGAFVGGSKDGMARVAAFLADKGMAAAAPNHFIADPKNGVPGWPRNLYDCKAAVAYLRTHAQRLKLDPDRFAGLGHSSGAYLALMVAFTPHRRDLDGPAGRLEQSLHLSAVVNISGVVDRREGLGIGTFNLLGAGYENRPELRALASPIVHVNSGIPPVYTLHGQEDKTVLPESARRLDAAMRAAGAEHHLNIVPGFGHNPVTARTLSAAAEWLRRKLRTAV